MMFTEAILSWIIKMPAVAGLRLLSIMRRWMRSSTSFRKRYTCRLKGMTQKFYLKEMRAGNRFLSVLLMLDIFCASGLRAQQKTPALERVVTVKVSSESLENILEMISRQAHCTFSYNPEAIPV